MLIDKRFSLSYFEFASSLNRMHTFIQWLAYIFKMGVFHSFVRFPKCSKGQKLKAKVAGGKKKIH